jgi:hypothetical protein
VNEIIWLLCISAGQPVGLIHTGSRRKGQIMNKDQKALMIELLGAEKFEWDMLDYPYSMPDKARVYGNSRELISDVSSSGSHFFCGDTMKAFGTKLYGLAGQRFLVMSDAAPSGRLYRVAYVYASPGTERLSVERLGGFTGRRALDKAAKLAQTLALTFPITAE